MMANVNEENQRNVEKGISISSRLFWLLILSSVLFFVGIAVILIAMVFYGIGLENVSTVIFIGPFPIVIGSGPDVEWVIFLSIILGILSVVIFLVMNRRIRRIKN
jgi:uncharacterized membrane protein